MKTQKVLFGLTGLMLAIFLISSVSAISTAYGEWSDGSSSITITNGQSAGFNLYFESTTTPMSISVKLYNSNNLTIPIYTFNNYTKSVSQTYYFNDNVLMITPAIYSSAGNFILVLSAGTSTTSLYLTVNALPPPANNAPVITSISNQTINENLLYSYQVIATDADNNALTYSLSGAPAGFTISSSGLISGTAPSVAVNTNYSITVQVSDGTTSSSKSYILTINNIPVIGNAPVITILGSNLITIQAGVAYIDAGATATDIEDGSLTTSIIKTSNVNVNILGNYTVVYSVTDSANNIVTATRNVSVVDTTAPVITLNGASTITLVQNSTYTELGATVLDNYDSSISVIITGSVNISVLGTYTITYSAIDSHGNSATPITRIVNIVSGSSTPNSSSGTGRTIHYTDVYENQYQEQLNQTNPKIDLGGPQTPSKTTGTTLFLIITAILILGILSAIFVLIRKR